MSLVEGIKRSIKEPITVAGITVDNTTNIKNALLQLLTTEDFPTLEKNVRELDIYAKNHHIPMTISIDLFEELGLTLLQKTRILHARGRISLAEQCYTAVLRLGTPQERQLALLNLGEIYRGKKEYAKAKEYYTQGLELSVQTKYIENLKLALMHINILTKEPLSTIENIFSSLPQQSPTAHFIMAVALQTHKQADTKIRHHLSYAKKDKKLSKNIEDLEKVLSNGITIEGIFSGLKRETNNDASYDNLPSALALATFKV